MTLKTLYFLYNWQKIDESKEAKLQSPQNEPIRQNESNNSLPMNEEIPNNDFTVKNFGKKVYEHLK